jgi:hypothetical protein
MRPGIISDFGIRIPELTDPGTICRPSRQSEIRNPESEMPSIANSPAGFPQPGCGVFIFCRVNAELSSVAGNNGNAQRELGPQSNEEESHRELCGFRTDQNSQKVTRKLGTGANSENRCRGQTEIMRYRLAGRFA